mmetsp:Transcript_25413/g.53541  ORF Transcript_25413/g.53541 Transcript_25413/m.53541 type:complete len:103 (-) Transcript_25413:435-743(-)
MEGLYNDVCSQQGGMESQMKMSLSWYGFMHLGIKNIIQSRFRSWAILVEFRGKIDKNYKTIHGPNDVHRTDFNPMEAHTHQLLNLMHTPPHSLAVLSKKGKE